MGKGVTSNQSGKVISAGPAWAIALGVRRPGFLPYRVMDPFGVQWHGREVPQHEILVASTRGAGAHVQRWLRAGRIERVSQTSSARVPGICTKCGCTWADACPGGCAWVDAKRTLCSSCFRI